MSHRSDDHLHAAHAAVDALTETSLELVREAVRMPSFSDTGQGIRAMAEWFCALLGFVAPDARLVETHGNPVVYGTVAAEQADAPTLVVYGLYDVTPTSDDAWSVPPLAAEIMDPSVLGLPSSVGPVIVGRGVHNHKGPMIAMIQGIRALLSVGGRPGVNLVFVIEGEEEIGSPSLAEFVTDQAEVLGRAVGVWLPCMQQNAAGTMTLRRGYKGTVFTHLSCRGGDWGGPTRGHVWAGNSAWVDAPLMQLVRALATLYDDDQRVTVDDLEDEVAAFRREWDDEVTALNAALIDDPAWSSGVLGSVGARRALAGKNLADHLGHYMTGVTINLQGIVGGYQGPSFYTMMPAEASARMDIRFPPGISPERVVALVRAHLDRRGFDHVVIENPRGYAGSPPLDPGTDVLLAAATHAASTYGAATSVWPIANNCCPGSLFTALGRAIPFSVAGLGCGGGDHAPDEWIATAAVGELMHFTLDFCEAITQTQVRQGGRPGATGQ